MKRWMWHMRELRARRVDTVYRCVFGIARECVIVRAVRGFGWPWRLRVHGCHHGGFQETSLDSDTVLCFLQHADHAAHTGVHGTSTAFTLYSNCSTDSHKSEPPTSAAQSGSPQRLRSSPAIASSTWMLTIGLARMHSPPSSVLTNVWWFSAQSESAHTRGGTGTALVASG